MSDAFLLSVSLAGLVGGLHCAGMCGAISAFAGAGGDRRALLAYQLARGAAYCVLGLTAGALGGGLNAVTQSRFGDVAAVLAAGTLVVLALFAFKGERVRRVTLSRRGGSPRVSQLLTWAHAQPPTRRAALIGAVTALLPCGWLYAFVVAAAGTGSAWAGGLTMLVFAMASAPALLGIGALSQIFAGRLRWLFPRIAGVTLGLVGIVGLLGRVYPSWSIAPTPMFSVPSSELSSEKAGSPSEVPTRSCH